LSRDERAWLTQVSPAGIILFRRNIANPKQTRALLRDATAFCAPHSLRCIDVEGGVVDRLRDALAPMPSPQAVARKAFSFAESQAAKRNGSHRSDPGTALLREHGELIARGAKAFGCNTTLAPVLDLALPASAQVMGTRAAASTANGVVEYARAFLAGLAAHGVVGCGKHFPGLGGGALDSHADTPAIERTYAELWRDDIAPYRELRNQLPMVMVNHAAYPLTPSKKLPATASAFWIETVLRKRIGFRGIVFSDDMEMGGILKFLPMEEAAVAAIRAGMDMLEICHSPQLILHAHGALVAEAERSTAFRSLLLTRARRCASQRHRHFSEPMSPSLSTHQFESLRTRILRYRANFDEVASVSATFELPRKVEKAATA
jgi:beta-N-acetylhexosaminidase